MAVPAVSGSEQRRLYCLPEPPPEEGMWDTC
jgi:hypothetical protein